ncbi:MAG: hypothetical protein IPL55_22720 [Saprospiraceae bacterium]|jgi:hypothetical protein|nr:hypothetical protein [Saprospiraceae bacterium]
MKNLIDFLISTLLIVIYTFPSNAQPTQLCRTPLSVFYVGMTGLGASWARTTCETTVMSAAGIADIQNSLRNTLDGLEILKDCYKFDTRELTLLISRIPTLTNVQAEAEIHTLVRKLQDVFARSNAVCDNRITLSSLYGAGLHLGAAQAHASCQQCGPTPMPMAFQTMIRNHLNTARDAFATYLPCVPGVLLSQFDAVTLNSMNSLVAHTDIVGVQINLLWNISLSDCCCECFSQPKKPNGVCKLDGSWTQDTPGVGSTVWEIKSDGTANERGIGYANGKAYLYGNILHIDWQTNTGYSGYYEWTLDGNCSSGIGTLVFKTGRTDSLKSTVKKY